MSLNRFRNETDMKIQDFNYDKFGHLVKNFRPEWLTHISLCQEIKKVADDDGFFDKFKQKFSFSDKKEGKGITYARERHLKDVFDEVPLPESVKFPFYFFDLRKFIQEERKFVLIIKEIQLLNLISCVVNALAVCRAIGLPHGNLSSSTIFKKSRFEWEISPPLYSRVNLELRMVTGKKVMKMVSDPDYAIDYLVAPEVYQNFSEKTKCISFYIELLNRYRYKRR